MYLGKVSVDRNQLKTTDEELALEFGRLMDLFRRVFSSHARRAKMQRRLDKARADGLSWVEALEYAAELTVKPDPHRPGIQRVGSRCPR